MNIETQYIESYTSRQNDFVERDIKTIENNVRVMIKEANLSLKFWFETALIDIYLQNRVDTKLIIDDERTISTEVFDDFKLSINHLRIWKCVYYSSVDFKFMFTKIRKNKFIDREKRCVFLDYVKKTNKQYWMWASNLRKVIKHHKMTFSKNEKWRSEKLNLSIQTTNSLFVRRSIERSKKITEIAISENASNSIFDSIIVQSSESFVKFAIQSSSEKSMT